MTHEAPIWAWLAAVLHGVGFGDVVQQPGGEGQFYKLGMARRPDVYGASGQRHGDFGYPLAVSFDVGEHGVARPQRAAGRLVRDGGFLPVVKAPQLGQGRQGRVFVMPAAAEGRCDEMLIG